jgi:DNA-directed RNA polymerase specialized sigma24 family protein
MNARDREACLASARLGDNRARGELLVTFRPHVRVMLRRLRGWLQARLDEADLIQDALLEAHRDLVGELLVPGQDWTVNP